MSIVVSGLYFYPIKSCAGTALSRAEIGARGILCDRQWMIVDSGNRFLTQREVPKLSLIHPALDGAGVLTIAAPGMNDITLKPTSDRQSQAAEVDVIVWNDSCRALDLGDEIANWLSSFLKIDCRLVRIKDSFIRQVDQRYAKRTEDQVGFADGFPFLIISEESLGKLNGQLELPIPMNRFRPNIVVKGCLPFAEDAWQKIVINNVCFDVVKPCTRCIITTVNQATGKAGKEPLKTLSTFRKFDGQIHFGQNLAHANLGTIAVGDDVSIVQSI